MVIPKIFEFSHERIVDDIEFRLNMDCRHCNSHLKTVILDLGFAPPSNSYVEYSDANRPELYYPLRILVCEVCWLVQTEDYPGVRSLFNSDYAYFSSVSTSWLAHAKLYAEMIIKKLDLSAQSMVVELAANDGYLLSNFMSAGIPCLGIEPTSSTAAAAEQKGIPILCNFFTNSLAQELANKGKSADLIIGNNVYAHVPDINDFTLGLKTLLKPGGTITLEFPHVLKLVNEALFDTVYHEHFSYLSLYNVMRIFALAGLRVYDVEELRTHGGSLRIYGCHSDDNRSATSDVFRLLDREKEEGLFRLDSYSLLQERSNNIKDDLVLFLIRQKKSGKTVAGYGAAAKGNTLLNFAGIRPDLIPYVCDAALSKQNKYLPGSHIPILDPNELRTYKPDVVLLLPWNIKDELVTQLSFIREWNGRFAVAIPKLRMF